MKNDARFVVTTHWGTFSLDKASYEDYLAGKHWISWSPHGRRSEPKADAALPPNVSEEALRLCDKAKCDGFLTVLQQTGICHVPLPFGSHLDNRSVDELNLTVRASNGLKRAGVMTFGDLKELLETENGILSIRNLGQKSAKEIRQAFCEECFTALLPYEKAQYFQQVLDNHGASVFNTL